MRKSAYKYINYFRMSKNDAGEALKELQLKYGCNPNQVPARLFAAEGALPFEVLNGHPGYTH